MPSRIDCCWDGMVPSQVGAMLSSMVPPLLTRSMKECSSCWVVK